MTDWLSVMERGLKAVRFGIFRANDNLAYLLEGLCCAPEESKGNCGSCGRPKDAAHRPDCRNPDAREFAFDDVPTVHPPSSAASPQVAVVAPSPKQGSDSGPAEIDAFPRVPAGPHPLEASFEHRTALIHNALRKHQFRQASHASIGSSPHCSCGRRPFDYGDWCFHVATKLADLLDPK